MRRRGGRRRRYITPADAAIYIPGGRWGPRRVHVESCWMVLKAEEFYQYLSDDPRVTAGEAFVVDTDDGPFRVSIRRNAVWRRGRLFLVCPRCDQRAGRLYIPFKGWHARCRKCWGLNYQSQSHRSFWASAGAFLRKYPGLLRG